MSSSVHIDNKNNDILSFGEGTTQGVDNTIYYIDSRSYICN